MKPRIKKIDGCWRCKLRGTINGYGDSICQAYREWFTRNRAVSTTAWHGYFGDAGGPLK